MYSSHAASRGELYKGFVRICIPDWNIFKMQQTFENSLFARKKAELRLSHKWCWSFGELKQALDKIGFINISKHDFQVGNFPDLGKVEHRDGLIIQAQK